MKYLGIIISTLLLFLSQITWAQQGKPMLQERTKTALKEHHQTKVYPTKKAVHDQLMSALSEADRSLLEGQRTKWEALNQEQRQLMKQHREARKAGTATEGRPEGMETIREKRRAIVEVLKPVLEGNQEAIRQAMEELKNHHTEWKAERQAIIEQNESPETVEALKKKHEAHKAKRQEHRQAHKGEGKKDMKAGKGKHKGFKAAQFLLWDGQPREHDKAKH